MIFARKNKIYEHDARRPALYHTTRTPGPCQVALPSAHTDEQETTTTKPVMQFWLLEFPAEIPQKETNKKR